MTQILPQHEGWRPADDDQREEESAPEKNYSRHLRLLDHSLTVGGRTLIMGILNVTPDSFYDGGRHARIEDALSAAAQMADNGADIIDVGGESTRPGAEPVNAREEWRRIGPVVTKLASRGLIVSVDTYKSEVAKLALEAGASLINDISGGTMDTDLAGIAASFGAGLIIMHIKGTPRNMQDDPVYGNLMGEIFQFLSGRAAAALDAGVKSESIIVDPGIGFGKKLEHNLEIIRHLSILKKLPYPLLVGASRKSFIGAVTGCPVESRLEGSIGAAAAAVLNGADILRVHDVAETAQAAAVVDAIMHGIGA